MALGKKVQKVEQPKEEQVKTEKTLLEIIDENKDLKDTLDEIDSLIHQKDFSCMNVDRLLYDDLEPYYKERRDILKNIPDFWAVVITNFFLTFNTIDELTSYVSDVFIVEGKESIKLTFEFSKNDIIENDKIELVFQTPTCFEEMDKEMEITATEVKLLKKESDKKDKKDDDDDDDDEDFEKEEAFLEFLKKPTTDLFTSLVASIWREPTSLYKDPKSLVLDETDILEYEEDESDIQ
ncbi:hypothetical protein CYY_004566 [Polysphondylium violaceum]|uniref:Nucleosome assembly protein n=1 Tax=Polysphondylium violaceum TaxID=133409 RepID=A0A8J4PXW3_9MYCE|nr:hypothetical protein CYY_004566 [Polysphondylium violaceum]